MCLYESQVWQVMITYGGIILSFIKMVGAEQCPEERVLFVCMHVCMHQCWPARVRVRARSASAHQTIHLEVI